MYLPSFPQKRESIFPVIPHLMRNLVNTKNHWIPCQARNDGSIRMVLTFIPLPRALVLFGGLSQQMVGGEDCHNRLSAFTQNNVLQHIYSVGKPFTVLALSEVGGNPCGLMSAESTSSAVATQMRR